MIVKHIEGCTRTLGKSQGYMGLPVKDIVVDDIGAAMMSAWEPTPAEILRLAKGARLYLTVLGTENHPPVILQVGEIETDSTETETS